MAADQRRRDLEYQLRELQRERSDIVLSHKGDYSPNVSARLGELDGEIERITRELDSRYSPEAVPLTRAQLMQVWADVTNLRLEIRDWRREDKDAREARNQVIDRWILAILGLLAIVYGVVIALGVSVWAVR